MKTKSSPQTPKSSLPVSKQTAGGVAGAVLGGAIAGPVGAVVGAITGTIMGNRAAQGKPMISSGTVKTAKTAAQAVSKKIPGLKVGLTSTSAKSAKSKSQPPKRKVTASRAPKARSMKVANKRK